MVYDSEREEILENFGIQEILDGIDYAHARGVKTLLTLNTLMKDVEIETAHYNLSRIYEHGIDAVIVQDLGFFTFIKENFSWTSCTWKYSNDSCKL